MAGLEDKLKKDLEALRIKEGRTFGLPENGNTVQAVGNEDVAQSAESQEKAAADQLAAIEPSADRSRLDELIEAARQRVEGHKYDEEMERAQGIWNGVADLGRSIANLYYTTEYSPNGYKHAEGLSEAGKRRMEKAMAQREKEKERYYRYVKEGAQMDYKERARRAQEKAAADRLAAQKEANEAAVKKAEEAAAAKKAEQEAEDFATDYLSNAMKPLRDGTATVESLNAALDEMRDKGEINETKHRAAKNKLNDYNIKTQSTQSQRDYNAAHPTGSGRSSGGGSRSGGAEFGTHNPGEKITWTAAAVKGNAINDIIDYALAHDRDNAVRQALGYSERKTFDDMKAAVAAFFRNPNISKAEKDELRDLLQAKRDAKEAVGTKARPSNNNGSNGKRDWNSNGKKNW